ncbi:MAG: SseB family protein [Kineosporiaceae bacterium]
MTGWGSEAADSAGLPWAGRTLPSGAPADDGRADPAVRQALAACGSPARPAESGDLLAAAVELLLAARLLVPVVAVVAGDAVPSHRPDRAAGDSGAEMSVPLLGMPGAGRALPAFTGVDALAAWDTAARPVPAAAPLVARTALEEGCAALALDPAGPAPLHVPHPVLVALAQGRAWVPAWRDDAVAAALASACTRLGAGVPALRGLAAAAAADPCGLAVRVLLEPGLPALAVDDAVSSVTGELAQDETVVAAVTSLAVVVEAAPGG